MNFRHSLLPLLMAASGLAVFGNARSDDVIVLPAPSRTGGKPLMEALNDRHSTRAFADRPLPPDVLSSLLWAAQGVNRDDPDYRTAPSSRNSNEIKIYIVLPEGAYLYEPELHQLKKVVAGDLRAVTGTQEFVKSAPVNLVYVADQSKQPGDFNAQRKLTTACADVGFIAQNVYLFCSSAGLGTVFRAMLDAEQLHHRLRLPIFEKVLYAQSIGYPAKQQTRP